MAGLIITEAALQVIVAELLEELQREGIISAQTPKLDHAPLHRVPVPRVIERAHQLHGKGFSLARHRLNLATASH